MRYPNQRHRRLLPQPAADLLGLPKGAKEKQVLAWWLRTRTVVSRDWVSQQLQMGHTSRVTQAVATVKRTRDRAVVAWRERLQGLDS